jgi:predicted deacylase
MAEYASVEAALQIGRSLSPQGLRGRVIVAPVVNMPAFRARSIYVSPLDGKNLNRMFPGKPDGTVSEQLAYWLFQNLIRQADFYLDLHGGDLIEALVPFSIYYASGNEAVDDRSAELAHIFGIEYVVCGDTAGSAYSSASQAGIPSMIAEAGGQGLWPPEAVALLTNGVNRVMRHAGILPGSEPEPVATQLVNEFDWPRSDHTGFYYPKADIGQVVVKGQDLGVVTDFQGRVLQTVTAPGDGRILFIVSSLAINKGDPLLAVGA